MRTLFLVSLCLPAGSGVSCVHRSISAILSCVDLSCAASRQTIVVCPSRGASVSICLSPSVPWEGSLRERGCGCMWWVGVDIRGVRVSGGASGFKGQSASIFCTDIQHSFPQVVSSSQLPPWVDWGSALPFFISTPPAFPLFPPIYKSGPPSSPHTHLVAT